jgi:hypothetical protein
LAPSPAPSPASLAPSVSTDVDAVIVHDAEQFNRVRRGGTCVALSITALRIAAMAIDSRGHVAHIALSDDGRRCRRCTDCDTLQVHKVDGLRFTDAHNDSAYITKSHRLAPPRLMPENVDCVYRVENYTWIPKWMGLVAVAFDADDRAYVLDRGCATGSVHLYQSRAPIAESVNAPVHTPSWREPAGVEVPCDWNLVAELSAMFEHARYDTKDRVFLAAAAFRRRVYVGHSTCVYVVHLNDADNEAADAKNRRAPGDGEVARSTLGRVEILAGFPNRSGRIDGDVDHALFTRITGFAMRTRAVESRDVAPAVAAICGATATGAGTSDNRWPPGVPEIVEAYARASPHCRRRRSFSRTQTTSVCAKFRCRKNFRDRLSPACRYRRRPT